MTKRTTRTSGGCGPTYQEQTFRIGERVQVTGSSAWLTSEPVTIIDFGRKDGYDLAVLSDDSWAYVDELRKL